MGGGVGGRDTPLKCSNMAKLLRSWIAITFKQHVKSPEQFCLCMLTASLASSWGYFPPQPGGGISAPNSSSSLGLPHPPVNHEGPDFIKSFIMLASLGAWLYLSPLNAPTDACLAAWFLPQELTLLSSLVRTSRCLQTLLRARAVRQHCASLSLGEPGLDLLGCDHGCLISQLELAVGLQAVSGVIRGFSLCSSCGPWGLEGWVL